MESLKVKGSYANKNLILPVRMREMKWIASRPKDSSLDTSKASRYLKEKPYDLDKALDVLKEEIGKSSKG